MEERRERVAVRLFFTAPLPPPQGALIAEGTKAASVEVEVSRDPHDERFQTGWCVTVLLPYTYLL
jgi:hypothetical protein